MEGRGVLPVRCIVTIAAFCAVFGLLCSAENVSAYTASITTSSSVVVNVSPSGDGTSIKSDSISVVSNCRSGYNLTIATPSGSNLYLNGDSTNNNTPSFTAVDGTSALSSSNNTNKWGYTITSNPTSSTVFLPLSSTPSVLKTASQTASPSSDIDDTFSISFGTKVDNTVNPGSYGMANNGSIVYYLTMAESCNVVDIAYDGNNADEGTMGAAYSNKRSGDTISLIASNFSRSGYGFAGWSFDKDAGDKLSDNDRANNPIVYGPQEDIILPSDILTYDTDNDGGVKLYAVWIESQGSLQGWMGCNDLDVTTYDSTTRTLDITKNSVTALTDQRDGDTYAVARLADGKCWMIENLRLEADATRGNNQTDPTITNEWLSRGYGKSDKHGSFVGLADPEFDNLYNSTTANSIYYSGVQSGDATINIGAFDSEGFRFPRYNDTNTSTRASSPTSNNDAIYSYGNYYSWPAAMANTSYYNSPTAQDEDGKTSETVNTSLCPSGWKLPYGRDTGNGATAGGFSYLDSALGGTGTTSSPTEAKWRSYPNNFLYTGLFTSKVSHRGTSSFYWSSTAYSYNDSYYLSLNSIGDEVRPGTEAYYYKSTGLSIRCIASDPENYTLAYDANGGSGAPGSQTTTANGSYAFVVSTTTPTRSGYTFAGWTDEKGNEVRPGDTYRTRDTNITLYAIWANNSCNSNATTIGTGNTSTDAVCLQDVTPNMKTILPTADATTGTYTLIDARDGQSYTVAKLADGNLWLTSDLRLGSTERPIMLTNNDTDSASPFLLPIVETDETKTQWGTLNSTEGLDTTHAYKYGDEKILYNWYTATAKTSYINLNATTSICPLNWKLVSKTQAEGYLSAVGEAPNSTNTTILTDPPLSFSNGYYDSTTQTVYTNKVYWTANGWQNSSTKYYYGYYFGIGPSSNVNYVRTTYGYQKMMGLGIRCIASNGTFTINYDGNGTTEYPVTGSVAPQVDIDLSSTVYAQANGFARTSWVFNGWNTAADGSGTAIAANAAIGNLNLTPGSTIILYAQWTPLRQIIYNDNCSYNNAGCATNTDTTNASSWTKAGNRVTLGGESYFTTRAGYLITSWNTARDGSGTSYDISSRYTVPSDLTSPDQFTLYAQWSPVLTINFDSNGGTGTMISQSIPENSSKALTSNSFTSSSGYFVGWMTEESRVNNEVIYTNGATYTTPTTVIPGDSVTLYAKWGPRYTIVYNGNNATGGSMISGSTELKHTNTKEGNTIELYAPNYWKTNYGFAGWSPNPTAVVGGADPIYGLNETISAPAYDRYGQEINGTKTVTLYAIWLEADSTKTMQTFTTSDCQNLSQTTFNSTTGKITAPAGSVIALKDQRDNNVYTIARLADGKCWMTENLRLEAENTVGNNQYDPSVINQSLSQGYGGVFEGLDSSENTNFDDVNTATPNNLYNSTNIIGTDPNYRFPRYNNNNTNTSLTAIYSGTTDSSIYYSWYSYGNYYTWAAAMANTTHYEGSSGSQSAGTSICPTNWALPTSGTSTRDFGTLSQSYGGTGGNQNNSALNNRFRTFPNNFIFSGTFKVSSAELRGAYGYYWSRSAYSYIYSYILRLEPTYLLPSPLSPSYHANKDYGCSVRCLIGS